jgi:5'-nucleotidase
MRVLVTNDDGIASPGLHALAAALVEGGWDILVAAPVRDCSGMGAALGPLHLSGRVDFTRAEIEGVDCEAVAVDGPPALCAFAACLGGFGPRPDIIVSGINAGANTGRAVLYSGTVGAALSGMNFNVPGIAVSQVVGTPTEWASAAAIAVSLVEPVLALPTNVVLSLNVPNLALASVKGPVSARLDPGGRVEASMVEHEDGVLELRMPESRGPAREGTDDALLAAGYATLTAIVGPHATAMDLDEICRQAMSA